LATNHSDNRNIFLCTSSLVSQLKQMLKRVTSEFCATATFAIRQPDADTAVELRIRQHQRRSPTERACPSDVSWGTSPQICWRSESNVSEGKLVRIRVFLRVLSYLRNRCLAQIIACKWNGNQRNTTLGQMKGCYQSLEMLHRVKAYIASGFMFWKFLRTWFSLHIPIPRSGFECLSFQAACDSVDLWRVRSLFLKIKK
jgi:hypothetical protein